MSAVRVVLVETTHPGNIGATARAMWTMGLERLVLVAPQRFPSAQATARASGGDEVLYRATVCETLTEAVADCAWVVGATARRRRLENPPIEPRAWAARAAELAPAGEVALVLGREHSGLTNAELDQCHALARIPTNPAYESLNLAAAVQIFAYELRLACVDPGTPRVREGGLVDPPATAGELEGLYEHLRVTMEEVGYYDADHPKLLMRRLRRLIHRVALARSELNILRGFLTAVRRKVGGGS